MFSIKIIMLNEENAKQRLRDVTRKSFQLSNNNLVLISLLYS